MALTIHGLPLSAFHVGLTGLTNWIGPSWQTVDTIGVPGTLSAVTAAGAGAPPRVVTASFLLSADTLEQRAERTARFLAALDGRVPLGTPDAPNRRALARVYSMTPWTPLAATTHFALPALRTTVEFLIPSGGMEDVDASVYALSTTPTEIPLGSLPSDGLLTIMPGSGAITVTCRSGRGAVVSATVIDSAAFPSNGSVVLDIGRRALWAVSATGVRTRADERLSSADPSALWPRLDPADAVGSALVTGVGAVRYPSIALSSGTGTLVTRRHYRM